MLTCWLIKITPISSCAVKLRNASSMACFGVSAKMSAPRAGERVQLRTVINNQKVRLALGIDVANACKKKASDGVLCTK